MNPSPAGDLSNGCNGIHMKKHVISSCINRSDLSDAEKRILRHIISLLGIGSTELYAGVSGIAKKCRVSDRTVQTSFRRFQKAGILVLLREQVGGRLPRVYSVVPAAILALSVRGTQAARGEVTSPLNALGEVFTPKFHRKEYSTATAKSPKTPSKEEPLQNLPAVELTFDTFFASGLDAQRDGHVLH